MKLQPLDDRIVVRPSESEETTASGLVIPDTAKEKPQQGEVLAVARVGVPRTPRARPLGRGRRRQGRLLEIWRYRDHPRRRGAAHPFEP